jgi:GNAT superfamily N-acetyltransferase
MLSRCAPTTLFHRFHGPTDGVAYTRAMFEDQPGDATLLAWNGSVCVGLATLANDAEGIAHLGVLVEDAWQRRRVGTRLVAALIEGAPAGGISTVRADVLGEDRFILAALRRIGPSTVDFGLGTFSVHIDLTGTPRRELQVSTA